MKHWINYHHLNYFRVIAQEGSISKAAEKLKIGQPTLSAQLKQFEDTIGIQLFEHHHRKLVLTEQGLLALEYAKEIFKMGDELLEVLHDKKNPSKPHVQIGALDSVSKSIVARVAQVALKADRCTVSFLEGNVEELVKEMAAHKIDLVISNYVPRLKDEIKIYSRSISKQPVHIYGAKEFLFLKHNFPYSLENAPFVLPTAHSKLRHDIEYFFKKNKIELDIAVETQDTALQKLLGVESVGVIPLSPLTAQTYLKERKLFEIGKIPDVFEEIFFLSTSRKIENPISSHLMKNFKL